MDPIHYLLNIPSKKIKYGLSRTYDLLSMCGNPEKNLLTIQIVGTNGKGSVASLMANTLQDGGYRVGLYTSPHLIDIKERIRINFKMISNQTINFFLIQYNNEIEKIKPSFFELMTVIAIWYFKQQNIDLAILETGLGGRLDSVTACKNDYIVFTSISSDHNDILGSSLEKIAKEKGGAILSSNQICLSIAQKTIIKKTLINQAKKAKNKIDFLASNNNKLSRKYFKYFNGQHQYYNSQLAQAAIEQLIKNNIVRLQNSQVIKSMKLTFWPGRFQIISKNPTVIYDVAHNTEGIKTFIETFKNLYNNQKYKFLICGLEYNKKIQNIAPELGALFDEVICTETGVRKSMAAKELENIFNHDKTTIIQDANQALNYIIKKANNNDIIAIVGSHFFAPFINNYYKNCFAIHK